MYYARRNVSNFAISLQKMSEIVNRVFREMVYIEWLDREFYANNRKAEAKRKYRVSIIV